jgi:uncharacterized membrane protein YdjX (TVP38/TMEM64 family)
MERNRLDRVAGGQFRQRCGFANGMIYGPYGTVINSVGAMLGAAAAFGLARLLGWPFVRRIQSAEHC